MDLRNPVLAVLVGGAPSPGINSLISSVTIESLNSNCSVVGFYEGFKHLKAGRSLAKTMEFDDVTRVFGLGGSLLRTSKQQLSTAVHVENCLRVLEHHRVRYLVCIGGAQTAYSASLLASAAERTSYKLNVVVVPKTIFNDLPLGEGLSTFGHSTAVEQGSKLVQNFAADARTMLRWYILVCMGQRAGHLTLGIGKAGAATLTLIAEEYLNRPASQGPLTFHELVTVIEATIIKRKAMGKDYGVACISEGLVSCMDSKEVIERWGDYDTAHSDLGRHLIKELQARFAKAQIDATVVTRHIGNELRSAPPNAQDITLTRDLGFAATRVVLENGPNSLVTLKGGPIHVIPLRQILDPQRASTLIRLVDTQSLGYQVAQSYSIVLRRPDLKDSAFLARLSKAANLSPADFIAKFGFIAAAQPNFRNSSSNNSLTESSLSANKGKIKNEATIIGVNDQKAPLTRAATSTAPQSPIPTLISPLFPNASANSSPVVNAPRLNTSGILGLSFGSMNSLTDDDPLSLNRSESVTARTQDQLAHPILAMKTIVENQSSVPAATSASTPTSASLSTISLLSNPITSPSSEPSSQILASIADQNFSPSSVQHALGTSPSILSPSPPPLVSPNIGSLPLVRKGSDRDMVAMNPSTLSSYHQILSQGHSNPNPSSHSESFHILASDSANSSRITSPAPSDILQAPPIHETRKSHSSSIDMGRSLIPQTVGSPSLTFSLPNNWMQARAMKDFSSPAQTPLRLSSKNPFPPTLILPNDSKDDSRSASLSPASTPPENPLPSTFNTILGSLSLFSKGNSASSSSSQSPPQPQPNQSPKNNNEES